MSAVTDIEKSSLEAHVSLCELRYQALERRIDLLERKLESVETLLLQIRDTLSQQPGAQSQAQEARWNRFQWYLIGVLGMMLAWSLPQVLKGLV
jgi:hypothetical protein